MENLKELNLQTLDNSELESVEGGTPLVGAMFMRGGGLLLGGLIVEQVVATVFCYLLRQ
jgi:hypothetical protein